MMTLTPEQKSALKAAAEKAAADAAGQWEVWDSCSWRRIGVGGSASQTVIEPVTQRDGHPDLKAAREVLDYVALANPTAILSLLSEMEGLQVRSRPHLKLGDSVHVVDPEYESDYRGQTAEIIGMKLINGNVDYTLRTQDTCWSDGWDERSLFFCSHTKGRESCPRCIGR